MIGGKVIGLVRREGLPTLLNVGGAGDEIFAAAALLGEAEVRCDEPGIVRLGDEVWWDDHRVLWTPQVREDAGEAVTEWVGQLGDVAFKRRA